MARLHARATEAVDEKTVRGVEPGNRTLRVMTQLSWLASIAREGALFDVIGRRKA